MLLPGFYFNPSPTFQRQLFPFYAHSDLQFCHLHISSNPVFSNTCYSAEGLQQCSEGAGYHTYSRRAELGVLPWQLGFSVNLGHFASSLGPQFPCLYNWKSGPDVFQGCSTLRTHDLDAQCASLLYLEGLWSQRCLVGVGVTPYSGRGCLYYRHQERKLTRYSDRDGFLERNSAWEGERIPAHLPTT